MDTNQTPLVSIGIPVFNGEKYLSQALDSAINQDYPNIEIIITDNASTDRTAEICQTYVNKNKHIRYLRNPENLGAAKNFTKVLEESNGDYFTWLACDDILSSENYITKLVNFMQQNQDVVLCGCSIKTFYDEDPQSIDIRTFNLLYNDQEWKKARLSFFKYPQQVELMLYGIYRSPTLKKIPIVNKNFKHPDLFATFLLLGKLATYGRIVALPDALRSFRCNIESLSYTIEGLRLTWHTFKIKISILQLALQFPCSWGEKIRIIQVALSNFNPFKRGVSMKYEIKLLRKEIAILRKECAERLNLIHQLNESLKNSN